MESTQSPAFVTNTPPPLQDVELALLSAAGCGALPPPAWPNCRKEVKRHALIKVLEGDHMDSIHAMQPSSEPFVSQLDIAVLSASEMDQLVYDTAVRGSAEVVDWLIRRGANPEKAEAGATFFESALKRAHGACETSRRNEAVWAGPRMQSDIWTATELRAESGLAIIRECLDENNFANIKLINHWPEIRSIFDSSCDDGDAKHCLTIMQGQLYEKYVPKRGVAVRDVKLDEQTLMQMNGVPLEIAEAFANDLPTCVGPYVVISYNGDNHVDAWDECVYWPSVLVVGTQKWTLVYGYLGVSHEDYD